MKTSAARRITTRLECGTFTYLEHGDPAAPVVLCVHGFPDHARTFDPIAVQLGQAGFRCVAPWLRGYAPSTLDGPFDMGRIADDILALKRAVSPDAPVILVGHDWGAVAAHVALALAPTAFSHAVTLAVPHPLALLHNLRRHPRQLGLSWYMGFFQLRGLADRVAQRDQYAFIDRLWRDWSPGYRLPAEEMRDLKRCLHASWPAPLEYYRTMLSLRPAAVSMRQRLLRQMRAIAVPTLYLHGERDGCMLYAVGAGQERCFTAGFESECVPDVGHFLHLEAPELVARKIAEHARS